MKYFRIIENVYRKHVTVFVEPDRKKAEAWIKERTTTDKDLTRSLACTLYPQKPGLDVLVWVRHKNDITSLVHEFTHVVFYILHTAGVPLSFDGDEAVAYLHEYFVAQALQKLGHRKLVGSL